MSDATLERLGEAAKLVAKWCQPGALALPEIKSRLRAYAADCADASAARRAVRGALAGRRPVGHVCGAAPAADSGKRV